MRNNKYLTKQFLDDQIMKNDMGGAYSKNGREEKLIQNVGDSNLTEGDY
jgi:hypothetical protein